MRRLNIRWRLTLWFGAAMTVLLLVRSFWIYFMMERRLATTTGAELERELDTLEVEIKGASDRVELLQTLERFAMTHRDLEIGVVGDKQSVLFRTPSKASASGAIPFKTAKRKPNRSHTREITQDGTRRQAVTEELTGPLGPLTLEISRSTQAEQNEIWDFAVLLLTTGPMVVLGALAVGYLVSSRALTPVDKMICAANDITAKRLDQRIDVPDTGDELARLARTLNEMIDRLYKSFEEMRRFTADAAHDLRTPVAALRTEVEVSLLADRTVEEFRHSMQTVLDEAIDLSRLTAQLLDLSREDHGVHTGQQEQVRLDLILQSVLEDLQAAAQQKQIRISTQIGPWAVAGDQVRLRRVFTNLLNNAIKYTPKGGKVWIEGTFLPEHVILVIADNGPGIPPEDLPFIFDRFRRVDQARNRQSGGTGLGLAICKSIVEAHGGQIRMESTIGHGTQVIVTLPTGKSSGTPLAA